MIFNLKHPKQRKEAIEYLESLLNSRAEIEIIKKGEKRRNRANRLYWAWLQCMQDETGEDKNKFHKYYKGLFLGTDEEVIFDKLITFSISTADLKVKPFWEYMQKIKSDASTEFGITLPLPEDKGFREFCRKYEWCFE